MPYIGYIEIDLQSTGVPDGETQACILLAVVPDTDYNQTVPAPLKSNVLSEFLDKCKYKICVNFLQKAASLHTSWYLVFRRLSLRQRE